MYGHLILDPAGTGKRALLCEERVLGMAVLCAEVPTPPGLREKVLCRRLYRAAVRLWEQGVNRVLVDREFPHTLWPILRRAGLHPIDPVPLCQEAAPALILALLARRGLDPARSTVCLCGSSAAGPVQNAALTLAPLVSRLVIDCPCRGGDLARRLNLVFGLPLTEPGSIPPDVTAVFAPERIQVPAQLQLYGPSPELAGLCLAPIRGPLPPRFQALPLLAALRESGLLSASEITVYDSRREPD